MTQSKSVDVFRVPQRGTVDTFGETQCGTVDTFGVTQCGLIDIFSVPTITGIPFINPSLSKGVNQIYFFTLKILKTLLYSN